MSEKIFGLAVVCREDGEVAWFKDFCVIDKETNKLYKVSNTSGQVFEHRAQILKGDMNVILNPQPGGKRTIYTLEAEYNEEELMSRLIVNIIKEIESQEKKLRKWKHGIINKIFKDPNRYY